MTKPARRRWTLIAAAPRLAEEQQDLIGRVHQRVNRSGEHRARGGKVKATNLPTVTAMLPASAAYTTRADPSPGKGTGSVRRSRGRVFTAWWRLHCKKQRIPQQAQAIPAALVLPPQTITPTRSPGWGT
jgi:hypothetical protein